MGLQTETSLSRDSITGSQKITLHAFVPTLSETLPRGNFNPSFRGRGFISTVELV